MAEPVGVGHGDTQRDTSTVNQHSYNNNTQGLIPPLQVGPNGKDPEAGFQVG